MTLNRHSRIAVAAVIAPLAVLAVACGSDGDASGSSDQAASDTATTAPSDPTETATSGPTDPSGFDYVADGVWHQADGDDVELRHDDYFGAVIWDGQLVATRSDGEVYAVADVVTEDGTVVDSFPTTSAVVANDAGTTIAWVGTDGEVMTAWDRGEVSMGSVDLAAPGETVAYFAAAVTGGPNCYEVHDGCTVFVNSGIGEPETFDSHGVNDNPLPFVIDFNDVSADHLVTYTDKIGDAGSCGGLVDLAQADNRPEWTTCDFEAAEVAPDGQHVIGLPSYYDGLGITEISVLDAADGTETGRYAPEGGFVSQWAWSTDGRVVFDAYDGAQWHLMTMDRNGAIEEIGQPLEGEDLDSPFTVIQH